MEQSYYGCNAPGQTSCSPICHMMIAIASRDGKGSNPRPACQF
jgi:hypothetical protein